MRQQRVRILPGETLWDGLKRENIIVDRPCGGKGTCGKCQVEICGIGTVKSCSFHEPGEYDVILSGKEPFTIVGQFSSALQREDVSGAGLEKQAMVIGIDLGTTTVAAEGITAEKTMTRSFVNPQRMYGADVMTRIESAVNGHANELENQIKSGLYKIIAEIVRESDLKQEKDVSVVVSGNTTMLHLLRGLSCEGLGKAPFLPVDLRLCQEKWEIPTEFKDSREAGNESEIFCQVTFLPGISAFVGGDIVSGIYGLNLMEKEDISLLLDLGTNGEMALIKEGWLLVTSAAAGPAFEGTPLSLELHAAGIINLLYFMRKENIIDEYGTLCDEYFEEGYPVPESFKKSHGEEASYICITQDDIRAIQMAKGAIRAGIEILLQEAQILPEQVTRIYLAGGMGFYLETQKAVGIGLLPEGFAGRIEAVGNSSLLGALKYGKAIALENGQQKMNVNSRLDNIVCNSREIVLAEHPDFEEKYIEHMNF